MSKNYSINEGNKIGYMPTVFGASGNSIVEKKLVASGDITKGQLVEVSDNLTVKVATAGSDKVIGVAMFDAKDGQPIVVDAEGLFRITAAANITAPAVLSAAADGKVITQTAGVPGTSFPTPKVGVALSDALLGEDVIMKFTH
jgi:predicted RecA/RadA family phage recombinase